MVDAPPTPSRRPRGRPRGTEARDAVLAAAYALLVEAGLPGLTMEGVATRAGAAKTTVYRWWSSREALAIDAFLAATAPRIAFPITESPEADMRAQMKRLMRVYRGRTGRLIRGIVAAADADTAAAEAFAERYIRPRRLAAMEAFRRGIATGAFRTDLDIEAVIDALYGPIFYRLLVRHAPLEDEWLDRLADTVFGGCRTRT